MSDVTGVYLDLVIAHRENAALKAERDALAAENDRMKKAIKAIFPAGVEDESGKLGFTNIAKECYAAACQSPATDAYLNYVRVEGAEAVAVYHKERADALKHIDRKSVFEHQSAYLCALDVANQLRAGEPS